MIVQLNNVIQDETNYSDPMLFSFVFSSLDL